MSATIQVTIECVRIQCDQKTVVTATLIPHVVEVKDGNLTELAEVSFVLPGGWSHVPGHRGTYLCPFHEPNNLAVQVPAPKKKRK